MVQRLSSNTELHRKLLGWISAAESWSAVTSDQLAEVVTPLLAEWVGSFRDDLLDMSLADLGPFGIPTIELNEDLWIKLVWQAYKLPETLGSATSGTYVVQRANQNNRLLKPAATLSAFAATSVGDSNVGDDALKSQFLDNAPEVTDFTGCTVSDAIDKTIPGNYGGVLIGKVWYVYDRQELLSAALWKYLHVLASETPAEK